MNFFYEFPVAHTALVEHRSYSARFQRADLRRHHPHAYLSESVISGKIRRNARGCVRVESHKLTDDGESYLEGWINDPNNRTLVYLYPGVKTAFVIPWSESREKVREVAHLPFAGGEVLGEKIIQGYACRGYRRVYADGGKLECWHANNLLEMMEAQYVINDERCDYQLIDVCEEETGSEFFVVPADYVYGEAQAQ